MVKQLLKRAPAWKSKAVRAIKRIYRVFPSSHYALLALMFMVGMEAIFILRRPVWVVSSAIGLVVLMIIGVVLVRFEDEDFSLHQIVLPILTAVGLAGYSFLLPPTSVLHLYIIGSGLMMYFLLKHGARKEYPLWNWVISLIVLFLMVSFVFGLRFHLYWNVIVILVIIMLTSFLMAWQSLRRVSDSSLEAALPALATGFVLTEVAWVLQFLPAHYLVQAGIITTLYYVIFSLLSISYTRQATRKDLIEYLLIGFAAIVIIVLSAQWS